MKKTKTQEIIELRRNLQSEEARADIAEAQYANAQREGQVWRNRAIFLCEGLKECSKKMGKRKREYIETLISHIHYF